MKTLKIITMLLLLGSFMACKKDKVTPEPAKEPFDIKQYVLVKKETTSSGWVKDIQLTSFEPQSKCIIFTELGTIPDDGFSYNYEDGILKLYYDLRIKNELTVENNSIISTTVNGPGVSFHLIKIPAENMFNGNTYAGGWNSEGSNLTAIASLKFTDTHFSEASFNLPVPDKTYELFKNILAYKRDIPINGSSIWLLSDGKLEGYRSYYNGNTVNRVTGTFIKQ